MKETLFFIILYLVLNSIFNSINILTLLANLIITILLIIYMSKKKLFKHYGLCKVNNSKKLLYFIPLGIITLLNLIDFSVSLDYNYIIVFMLTMLLVGFIEEVIFRGMLYKNMLQDNKNVAMFVSSLTFALGHILNLFMGSDLISTLLQVVYCFLVGYLFVLIFDISNSIWPCIISHGLVNSLSIFSNNNLIGTFLLIIFSSSYIFYIKKKVYKK